MRLHKPAIILGLAAVLALPAAVGAQGTRVHTITEENDTLASTDRNYTQGLQYSRMGDREGLPGEHPPLPKWAGGLFRKLTLCVEDDSDDSCYWVDSGFAFGQLIYTPENLSDPNVIPDDRPYAGWLYAGPIVRLTNQAGTQSHRLELNLGVTGPASLAEEAQSLVHEVIDSEEPLGWGNQVDTRVGFTLEYEWQRRLGGYEGSFAGATRKRYFDFVPHLGGVAGNIFDSAYVGFTTRLGYNLGDLIDPVLQPVGLRPDDVEAYVFVRADARAVLFNYFLEGTDDHLIDRDTFVYDVVTGAVIRLGGYRLIYSQVRRSEEFSPTGRRHRYGSISVSWSRSF
jgi:hypothetical protein